MRLTPSGTRAGETFPHDQAISEAEAQLAWVEQSQALMVAVNAAGAVVAQQARRPGGWGSGRCSSTWW
ncbi:MAG: hypothetical protein K0U63_00020 [Cyanobacteria bacterium]|nr:hypothetical protein [Cyanobacteriota bacterium]